MYWIVVVIVAFVIAIREKRKERKHSDYRSWIDDDTTRTFHRPGHDPKWY